jgi:hypothetical protein
MAAGSGWGWRARHIQWRALCAPAHDVATGSHNRVIRDVVALLAAAVGSTADERLKQRGTHAVAEGAPRRELLG